MKRHIILKVISIFCCFIMLINTVSFLSYGEEAVVPSESDFSVGELITEFDPSTLSIGNKTGNDSWIFNTASVVASPENSNEKVVRLDNETGDHSYADVHTTIYESDFVVFAVVGSDSISTKADGYPGIIFKDLNEDGSQASNNSFGFTHKNRAENRYPRPGRFYYTDGSEYFQNGNVNFEEDGYTKIKLAVYRVDGKYYYFANDIFIAEVKVNGEETNKVNVGVFDSYSFAYVHEISVYSLSSNEAEPEPEPEEPELSANGIITGSGFLVGDKIESIDFSNMTAGSISSSGNWSISRGSIAARPDGEGNALNLRNDYGSAFAKTTVSAPNYVVVATFGTNSNDTTTDGYPGVGINGIDADGEYRTACSLCFGEYYRTKYPIAGKCQIYDGRYTNTGGFSFDKDGYTVVTVTMYLYDGVFYCYIQGKYLGLFTSTDTEVGGLTEVVISEGYSNVYVHSIDIYNIYENSLKAEVATFNTDTGSIDLNMVCSSNDFSEINETKDIEIGAVVTVQDGSASTDTTINTEGADVVKFALPDSDNFNYTINVDKENVDKFYNVRPFVCVDGVYYYNNPNTYAASRLASLAYSGYDSETKTKVKEYFKDSKLFDGDNTREMSFTVFADFHYYGEKAITNISNLETILKRAEDNNSSFVIQLGDFTQDAKGSPELFNTYLNYEKQDGELLKAYGIYGNHDLESGSSMANYSPYLTNDKNVVWGTEDGKYKEDHSVGYYYFDTAEGFRVFCLDNNYSYNTTTNSWEHNRTGTYGAPANNINTYSLGDKQFAWFEKALFEAGEQDIPCIITTHASIEEAWTNSGASEYCKKEINDLFDRVNEKYPGTVMMAMCGHSHLDRVVYSDNILWVMINSTRVRFLQSNSGAEREELYDDAIHTVTQTIYDDQGNVIGFETVPVNSLDRGSIMYCSAEPMSANITINENGIISIDGYKSDWMFGVEPSDAMWKGSPVEYIGTVHPWTNDYSTYNCELYGHIFDNGVCEQCSAIDSADSLTGDVNGDNEVNAADLALLKKLIAKLIPLDSEEVKNANVDEFLGVPDAADLALLKKIIAKLI